MAATTAPRGPMMRTASTENVDIRHPMPDLSGIAHTPEGSICRNVERLEQSAETLSHAGSDLANEIRKLQDEQRRSDSRRSSLLSSPHDHLSTNQAVGTVTRSRGASASSRGNSIVDLNREARWGGYSPGAYHHHHHIGSPSHSIHSASCSQHAAVLQRSASNAMSSSTRPEPVQEGRPLDSPLASPIAPATRQASHSSLSHSLSIQNSLLLHHSTRPSRAGSKHSRRRSAESIHSAASADSPPPSLTVSEELALAIDTPLPAGPEGEEMDTVDDDAENIPPGSAASSQQGSARPTLTHRAASSETYRQANALFSDFDGVHFSPTHEEFVEYDGGQLSHPDLIPPQHRVSFAHPPPQDNMVYYPAPVPRMLNLPKKLSNKPPPALLAQRRSQVMTQAVKPAEKSPLQIGELSFEREQTREEADLVEDDTAPAPREPLAPMGPGMQSRASMATLANAPGLQSRASMATLANMSGALPPQLRASLFFDSPAATQNVDIQSDSAVATLDTILQASATAPVSVFTDHPFAGRAGAHVYAKERPRAAKSDTLSAPLVADARNSRISLAPKPKPARRRSITALLTGQEAPEGKPKLSRRNSVMSMLTDLGTNPEGRKLQKRNSRLSLASENALNGEALSRPMSSAPAAVLDHEDHEREGGHPDHDDEEVEDLEDQEEDEDEVPPDEDTEPMYTQPTTLLAELQLRKAQQKSRNRTAATAFPNGMHSTLLQLDAVAQIESRKRKTHKVALAWEAPELHAKEEDEPDEDVPLAVLYPTKNGLRPKKPGESDWDRPIGLIEKRQLEDNEPLSSRRNRILGIKPKSATQTSSPNNISAAASSRGVISPAYASSVKNQGNAAPVEDEDDLPLAERRRRIRQKATLDAALGDLAKERESKSTFEADMLSVLGGQVKHTASPPAVDAQEETLGQRRARLQREALAGADKAEPEQPTARAPLRQSMSLANLLSAVPLDPSKERSDRDRRNASSPAPGTLLGDHDVKSKELKDQMRRRNARTSSHTDRRSVEQPPNRPAGLQERRTSHATLLGLQSSQSVPSFNNAGFPGPQAQQQNPVAPPGYPPAAGAAFGNTGATGMLNPLAFQPWVPPAPAGGMGFAGGMGVVDPGNMMGGVQMQNPTMMMMPPMGGMGYPTGYPTGYPMTMPMPMPMSMPMGMGQMGQMGMPTPQAPAAAAMGVGVGGMMPGTNMPYAMRAELGMDPNRRETIDRWRSSVGR